MDEERVRQIISSSQNLNLLYVEDDEEARRTTLKTLSVFFQNITVSVDGEDGFNKFQSDHYDLVVTDINMPKLTGIGMIEKIRASNKGIDILVLSAYNESGYFMETIKLGIEGYLLKPIDLSQFIDLVYKVVMKIQTKKELEDYKANLEDKIKKQTNKILHQYYHEQVTGLYNIFKLQEMMEDDTYEYFIVLDIANFSLMNKQYGHNFANEILKEVANHFKIHIAEGMRLFKLESDKFGILSQGNSHENVQEFCEQVISYFDNSNLEVSDAEIKIAFTIGISSIDEAVEDDIVVNAEYALDIAKKIGKRYFCFYDIDSKTIYEEKETIKWLNYTKELIENDKIEPYFQPIKNIHTGEILKYEVLARGIDGDKVIAPSYFLEASHRLGLVSSLTRMIINKSFRFFQKNTYEFSINITERDLLEGYLKEFFTQKLQRYNIQASRITLEILENITLTDNSNKIVKELSGLRSMGFKIAIDDFGVENSNFSRLLDIDLDFIKLDGVFIKNLATNEKDKIITKAIVNMAKTLGVKTVAEFVENNDIYEIIKECGIDYAQGYHIGKPSDDVLKKEEE